MWRILWILLWGISLIVRMWRRRRVTWISMILLLLLILLLIKSFLLAVHTPHDDDDDILDTPEVTPIVLEHCNNDAGCHWRGPISHDSL